MNGALPPGAVQISEQQQAAPQTASSNHQRAYRPPTYTPRSSIQTTAPVSAGESVTATKKPSVPTYHTPELKSSAAPKSKDVAFKSKIARQESTGQHQDIRSGNLKRDAGLPSKKAVNVAVTNTAPKGKTYVMRPGDTLWSVASKQGTSINALRNANHLKGDMVAIGQTLLIPSDEIIVSAPASASTPGPTPARKAPTSAITKRTHVVKPNETFTKIARDYGITFDTLARANPNTRADHLIAGERLSIPGGKSKTGGNPEMPITAPAAASTGLTHIVKSGEHLGSIAKKYGISTAALAESNRLQDANIVVVGQKLIIPGDKATHAVPENLASNDQETAPAEEVKPSDPVPMVTTEPIIQPATPLPPIIRESAPAYPQAMPSAITLTTPPAPRGVISYRMERGDTLETVANMFSTTPQNIRALNKLSADKVVKEGEEIVVPSLGAVSVN
jgi:LysM repeat protein